MKKLEKYSAKSSSDDFPATGRHIHFLRIHAFVSESDDFTEEETAHFDDCRECRLKVLEALKDMPQVGRHITKKAA
jgi:hypothetical protein